MLGSWVLQGVLVGCSFEMAHRSAKGGMWVLMGACGVFIWRRGVLVQHKMGVLVVGGCDVGFLGCSRGCLWGARLV